MSKKRGKSLRININLSNRWLYTLILIGVLIAVAIGVYAATYSPSGAGHPYTEISTCGANEILKMNSAGNAWECSGAGGGSQWITSGNNIYYSTGNVGIGTSNPTSRLEVSGNTNIAGNFTVTNGHVRVTGSGTPTLRNCGTNSIVGTDSAGTVSGTTSGIPSCILVFNRPFISTPVCVISSRSQFINPYVDPYNSNTTTLTIIFSSSGVNTFNYICLER